MINEVQTLWMFITQIICCTWRKSISRILQTDALNQQFFTHNQLKKASYGWNGWPARGVHFVSKLQTHFVYICHVPFSLFLPKASKQALKLISLISLQETFFLTTPVLPSCIGTKMRSVSLSSSSTNSRETCRSFLAWHWMLLVKQHSINAEKKTEQKGKMVEWDSVLCYDANSKMRQEWLWINKENAFLAVFFFFAFSSICYQAE